MTYSTSEPVALHNAIMNIPMTNDAYGPGDSSEILVAYATGHKDARHAAAELVAASKLSLDTQLKIAFAEMWEAVATKGLPELANEVAFVNAKSRFSRGTRTTDLLAEMKRVTQSLRGEA